MSTAGITTEEMTGSLTGYDEIAIEKHMGLDVYLDGERKPMGVLRSLVFVHQRRQGQNDTDSCRAALEMSVNEVQAYFDEPVEEVDPEDPITEPGKDFGPIASVPSASQGSAFSPE